MDDARRHSGDLATEAAGSVEGVQMYILLLCWTPDGRCRIRGTGYAT